MVCDLIKGDIHDAEDAATSFGVGLLANYVGDYIANGLAINKVQKINELSNTKLKGLLRRELGYTATNKTRVTLYRELSEEAQLGLVKQSYSGFRFGIFSTVTSTAGSWMHSVKEILKGIFK